VITREDYDDIPAILFNGIITNNKETIKYVIINNLPCRPLNRAILKFMAACDLGENWEKLAKSSTVLKWIEAVITEEKK
jgi:hypothetical protein